MSDHWTPARSIPGFPGIDWQDGEIVCEAHGMAECDQDPCDGLEWPPEGYDEEPPPTAADVSLTLFNALADAREEYPEMALTSPENRVEYDAIGRTARWLLDGDRYRLFRMDVDPERRNRAAERVLFDGDALLPEGWSFDQVPIDEDTALEVSKQLVEAVVRIYLEADEEPDDG
jgi:hypothetical protein